MSLSLQCITVDTPDPKALTEFWAAALGWSVGEDINDVEVVRLENLGAKRIDIGQPNTPECTWVVMADPEGNEFCVLSSRRN